MATFPSVPQPAPAAEQRMHNRPDDLRTLDRRRFVQAMVIPAALPVAAALASSAAQGPLAEASGPDIIDCNVHLFDWPFRKLKYARTEALVAKLRKHRIT